ncbi:uncharacterized protein [Rutidosis leptorrhynchoides]|uniref:uncharacterized protein n=1 Tax=Rutidosis leptorrhynchoides TaxID=125765 RepID=UPI003A9984D8
MTKLLVEKAQVQSVSCGTIRNTLVPKKVELFVWRARKGRLPTLPELDKRRIDLNSVRCPICDGDIESLDHSLISCKLAKDILDKIFAWLGMGSTTYNNVRDLLNGDSGHNFSGLGKSIWQGILWASAYLMWKNRNDKVFKGKCWNIPVAVSEIQVQSFEWIAKRCKMKNIEWHNWLHNLAIYFS